MMVVPVSVLVLTLNEEVNLPRCLKSLQWCDDVVVLDSFSTDETSDIARNSGVRLIQRQFDNYANQRRYGLNEIKYKHAWLFMLDADEVFPDDLVEEISRKLAACDEETTLFRLRCKYYLFGHWIKHSTTYSSLWIGRLMRIGRVWIDRSINEEYQTDGTVQLLESSILHYPFNKGFHAWLEKHNRYSSMEAELKFTSGTAKWSWRDFRNPDPAIRRKAIKAFMYSLPARPLIMFVGWYFVKGGILDGRAGFMYCTLKTIYEYLIDCKVRELRRRKQGLPI